MSAMAHKEPKFPKAFAKNIHQLVRLQQRRELEASPLLRLSDPALRFFGSYAFLALNVVVFAFWIILNTCFQGLHPFDPFPFEFLTMFVSLEAIVLSVIVLIAQNKLQNDADERSQLDLHINLLTETETSLILKKLDRIEKALNISISPAEVKHVSDLIQETKPENLADFIHEIYSAGGNKKI